MAQAFNISNTIAKMEFNSIKQQALLDIIQNFISYGLSMHAIFGTILPDLYPKGSMNRIVRDINQQISQGHSLGSALAYWYSNQVAAIIKTGEESGNLEKGLKLAHASLATGRRYFVVFLKSIAYFLFIFVVSIAFLSMYGGKIMPALLPLMKEGIPWVTSTYQSYYTWIINNGLLTLLILGVFIALYWACIVAYTGSTRDTLDRLPFFSLYRKIIGGTLLEQVGIYFQAHILLDTAIKNIARDSKTPYLKKHCRRVLQNLEHGVDNVAHAFDTKLFDRGILTIMLAMGRVNAFEDKCLPYSEQLQQEVERRVHTVGKSIGILLLVAAAINIAWSVLAMYTAMGAIG